ncbi:MAG: pyrroloquinoline quinone biosynthesis protein C, partial [Psychrobacter sp.]|nr:pyrroloquinoline quinone biosynthesis protein C [Psychrobacter sp.]
MQEEKIALSVEAFEQAIMAKGQYYHIYHPFHIMMH